MAKRKASQLEKIDDPAEDATRNKQLNLGKASRDPELGRLFSQPIHVSLSQGLVEENARLDADRNRLALDREKEGLNTLQQDRAARKTFALCIFSLVVVWLAVLIGIVIAVGRRWLELSDPVVMVLITTTTINVLAFFLIVARYLFHRPTSS